MKRNEGKLFEEDWKNSYKPTGIYFMRLKDSAKWMKGEGVSFTPSNPCDAIQFTPPFLWLLELKSTKGTSVSFNPNEPYKKPKNKKTHVMIKANQVKEIMKAVESKNVLGGLIINFRPRKLKSGITENRCFFVHITDFVKWTKKSGKSSINISDCEEIGIEIVNKCKVSRYNYDIADFVERAVVMYVKKKYLEIESLKDIKDWIERLG